MCVLSIKEPIRKKSGNLFNDPRNLYLLFSYNLSILAFTWLLLMVLLWTTICWDSVICLMFLFFSHAPFYSYEILLICCLKYLYSCFSSYFLHLVFIGFLFVLMLLLLFPITVISLSLLFLMYFSRPCIVPSTPSSMLVCLRSPPFPGEYSLIISRV